MMPTSENQAPLPPDPMPETGLDVIAKCFSTLAGVTCGLLILLISYIVAREIMPGAEKSHGCGNGSGFVYFIGVPTLAIPTFANCLFSSWLSLLALRKHPTQRNKLGLWISLLGPFVVIAWYFVGFGLVYYLSS